VVHRPDGRGEPGGVVGVVGGAGVAGRDGLGGDREVGAGGAGGQRLGPDGAGAPGAAGPVRACRSGRGSVAAHAHARGRTADQVASLVDRQLVGRGVLQPDDSGDRNAAQLVGALQKHAEAGQRPPVVVVDGLDEARGHAFAIARDLLVRLARYAVVVVSTRQLREPGDDPGSTLLGVLGPAEVLDLDAREWAGSGLAAVREYLTARLSGVDQAMDAAAVADHLMLAPDAVPEQPFLLARLVGDQLRAHPVDTTAGVWQAGVAGSIYAAVDADIGRVPAPEHRTLPENMPAATFGRCLLTALTRGLGAGFPEEEWTATATPMCGGPSMGQVGAEDVSWVLEHLGRYIVQDGEAGVAVFRVAHQSLADHLGPPFTSAAQRVFEGGHAYPVSSAGGGANQRLRVVSPGMRASLSGKTGRSAPVTLAREAGPRQGHQAVQRSEPDRHEGGYEAAKWSWRRAPHARSAWPIRALVDRYFPGTMGQR
jgi:hypothetical protein